MPVSLVTGANGFAGSHMAEYLLGRGHRVICLVRRTSDLTNLTGLEVEYRYGDINDRRSLPEALKDVDYVFHFAGKTKAAGETEYMKVNAEGTGNIAEACSLEGINTKMVVYCSSLAAAGPQQSDRPVDEKMPPKPLTAYGRSKLAGEEYLRRQCSKKVRWCILRPTGIYGPKDKDIFIYFKYISKGWKIILSGPERKVSLIHAQDFAQLCYRAATRSPHGEIYMASDGDAYTWDQLSDIIARILHKKPHKITVPLWFTTIAASFGEALSAITGNPTPLNREKLRELHANGWVIDNSKARNLLGFQPEYPLLDGFKNSIQWYRKNGWLK